MNRRKFSLNFRRRQERLVLRENGFVVFCLENITEIKIKGGMDEGRVEIFLRGEVMGDIWDVDEITEEL